jgi:hypothetical protein
MKKKKRYEWGGFLVGFGSAIGKERSKKDSPRGSIDLGLES